MDVFNGEICVGVNVPMTDWPIWICSITGSLIDYELSRPNSFGHSGLLLFETDSSTLAPISGGMILVIYSGIGKSVTV